MANVKIKLGANAATKHAILIPVFTVDPAGVVTFNSVELKHYCAKFPNGLDLTAEEFTFVKDHIDLAAMVAAGLIVLDPQNASVVPTAAASVVKMIKVTTTNKKPALYVCIGNGKNVELVSYCKSNSDGLPLLQSELDAAMAASNYAALLAAQLIQVSDPV